MTQQYWWAPGIVEMPAMSIGGGVRGGYARVTWGSIGFAPNSFPGTPPPRPSISLDWGVVSNRVLHVFDGVIILRSYNNTVITYDLYAPEFETELLAIGTDETGGETVQPLVIGTITHMSPQRTGDDTQRKYYMPDFADTPIYRFYDDGVPIDAQWSVGGGYAVRDVEIVGEFTMSGTGNMSTIGDVFSWAATRLGLSFVNQHGGDTPINCAIYSQQLLIDFLDKIAYYAGYQFGIQNNVLTLVRMDQDNGAQTLDKYDSVSLSYQWPMSVKSYTAKWSNRVFDPDTATLMDDPQEVVYTNSPTGAENTVDIYDEAATDVEAKIAAMAGRDQRVRVSLSLPLDQLPNIGEKINFVDRKSSHNISGYLRVRQYDLDYSGKKLNIQGDGEIIFT